MSRECKEKEIKDKDYEKARDREMEEVKKGNLNYKGIGRQKNQKEGLK